MNSPRVTAARVSTDGAQLAIESTVSFAWAPSGSKFITKDTWKLAARGSVLTIQRSTSSPRGQQNQTLVFDRR
jgi:hypothetical protein